jgi:hypothetical protein
MAVAEQNDAPANGREAHWLDLREKTARRSQRRNLRILWPEQCGVGGGVLRWGVSVAFGAIPETLAMLSRIAAKRKFSSDFDLSKAAENFVAAVNQNPVDMATVLEGVAWAYAMPELAMRHESHVSEDLWWELLGELQGLQRVAIEQLPHESMVRLLAGGEIGAVLAWRMIDLPSCAGLQDAAMQAVAEWFDKSGHSVAAAVSESGRWGRVVLASAIRCRRLAARASRRVTMKKSAAAIDLATWMATLVRADGSAALQPSSGRPMDDLASEGLFDLAVSELGGPSLQAALDASLGRGKPDGKSAWKVELPEPGWFDEDSQLAVMLPDWDVRKGRLAVHYEGKTTRMEIGGGKRPLVAGDWEIELKLNGKSLHPTGPWSDVCWYSDDDVHYLEIEQSFDLGLKVQRQWLMIRDDQCLMLADAVIGGPKGQTIEYRSLLPLLPVAGVEEEPETRELYISDGKPRALVLPLSLNEWRVGMSAGVFRAIDAPLDSEEDPIRGLMMSNELRGEVALYAPLWFDFDKKRMSKPRTWRRLTVGQSLALVPSNEAAAFRIQLGDDQWLIYRSLNGQHNRTFLGKNLVSEFFCGRFDSENGDVEELISVDEQPD